MAVAFPVFPCVFLCVFPFVATVLVWGRTGCTMPDARAVLGLGNPCGARSPPRSGRELRGAPGGKGNWPGDSGRDAVALGDGPVALAPVARQGGAGQGARASGSGDAGQGARGTGSSGARGPGIGSGGAGQGLHGSRPGAHGNKRQAITAGGTSGLRGRTRAMPPAGRSFVIQVHSPEALRCSEERSRSWAIRRDGSTPAGGSQGSTSSEVHSCSAPDCQRTRMDWRELRRRMITPNSPDRR